MKIDHPFRPWLCWTYALAVLMQPLWHAWLAPPSKASKWMVTLFFLLPTLPALALYALGNWRANTIAAITLLFYFIFAVMQLYIDPIHRVPAALMVVLCVLFNALWLKIILAEKRAARAS
jgi:uncharacterized membrane protein